MTKNELIDRLHTSSAIARLFGIKRQAVDQWPDAKPIPELRLLQLQRMKPHWFRTRARNAR